jgi:hypothetical protein
MIMKKLITLIVLLSMTMSAFAADRYWVGASGNTWENTASWSATLGGTSGSSVPVANDNVYIPLTTNITIPVTSATTFPTGFNILAISGAFTLTFTYNSTTTKSIIMNSSATGGFTLASGTTLRILGTAFTAGTGYTNGRLNLSISGGGTTTNIIDGTIIMAGASGQIILGSSTTLNVNGTIRHFAAAGNISTSGTFNVNSTAVMEWYRNGGSLPGANWNVASTIKYFGAHTFDGTTITAISSGTTAGLTFGGVAPYNYPNIEINVPNSSGVINWSWPSNCVVKGNINIIGFAGGGTLRMASTLTNLIVNGNFTTNGLFSFASSGTTSTMTVDGSINFASGTVDLQASTANMQVIAKGSVTIASGCTLTESGTSTNSRITFLAASGDQNISQNGTITNTIKLETNKAAGNVVPLTNITMPATSVVSFVSGKMVLGSNNLTTAGAVTGTGATGWVVTDGTGTITMQSIGTAGKAIAVGPTTGIYAGINIVPTSTNDFTVSAKSTFAMANPVANAAQVFPCEWNIVSASTNANIEFETPVGMTCPAGTRVIGHYVGGVWVETPALSTGYNLLTASSASFTSFSPFGFGNACGFAGGAPSTAVLAGDASICPGAMVNLTAAITGGVSPYTLVYSGGTVPSYVSGVNIPVSPSMTTMYTLTSVTDANGCVATSPSGSPTVTITTANNAMVTGNWMTGATWSCGTAPTVTSDVTIPMGVIVTLDAAAPTVNSLTFTGGGQLVLGANTLTVTGSMTGGAMAGYVVTGGAGQLKSPIAAGAMKTFPIGTTASSFDPISITPTNAVIFGVYVKPTITNPLGTNPATAASVVSREWEITPSATPGATTLAFTADATALNVAGTAFDFATPTAGTMGHWNTALSVWENFPTTYVAGTRTWTLAGYTGTYSPFIIASPEAVLAVEFTNINAVAKGTTNDIYFSTATEKDVKEFAIERSTNNKTWETIGTKAAIGGSTAANYNFTDVNPATLSYYRVKSIETSGKEQTSKVVAVKRNGGKLAILAVFPMPYTEGSSIDFSVGKSSTVAVTVTDIVGRVVQSTTVKTTEGANNLRLNLSSLTSGSYILTMNDGETVATQRIVKQ